MEDHQEDHQVEAAKEIRMTAAGPKMAVDRTTDMATRAPGIVDAHPADQGQKTETTAITNKVETEGVRVAKI